MRVWICCCVAALLLAGHPRWSAAQLAAGGAGAHAAAPPGSAPPMSDEDKANDLSDQVGKLMVKCVNLLTANDPLALDFCKQQRDLAEQYPPHQRVVDKMLAHDEYGIALAAFDHPQEALLEFNAEIALVPKAVKLGSVEWSTAYWHRAMLYTQMGQEEKADLDYRLAEASMRTGGGPHADSKMRSVLRQHAALLRKEGKTDAAEKLLQEANR